MSFQNKDYDIMHGFGKGSISRTGKGKLVVGSITEREDFDQYFPGSP